MPSTILKTQRRIVLMPFETSPLGGTTHNQSGFLRLPSPFESYCSVSRQCQRSAFHNPQTSLSSRGSRARNTRGEPSHHVLLIRRLLTRAFRVCRLHTDLHRPGKRRFQDCAEKPWGD